MNLVRILVALALVSASSGAFAGPTEEFYQLLDDAWEWELDENPLRASKLGDRRANDRWADRSLEAIERRFQDRRAFLARLRSIDTASLSEQDQLNYELFRRQLQADIDANKYRSFLMPISQRGGVQSLESEAESVPLSSVQDYEDWLVRMASVERVVAQTMALQEAGRKEGYMSPRILMQRIPDQIAAQLVENAQDSPFYAAFEDLPESFSEDDQVRLRKNAKAIIDEKVVPAYRKFHRYFVATYLPASRDSIGASSLPNGKSFYEFRTRHYTTTSMSPNDVHRVGLNEVARIRSDMQMIIDELEFDGDFAEFLHFLRTDPQFYHDDPQALFNSYLAICKRIDPELVKLFGTLPRMPYGLRAIPDNIAPDTTTAYYMRPSADGSRAGYYYVNLYRPEVRPIYEMEVLSVHEAMPGHHLQIALQMELPALPKFRLYSGFTAFTEGWGLYSESLGHELGLYKDPYSRFGALTYEMWRAVRLVVDTGIHYKGWTRQQAIDFFKDNAAKTELDIINEIDRYISWPGQALAYKVGQLKILELRRKTEQMLGKDFDIRAFHDELLGGGALPLDLLETRMNLWLAAELKRLREQD
jgi:uncharacterized protein (DUF885 family)